MKVTRAEFVISAASPSQYPKDNLPEVALVGRSNVGKSSLINRLAGRRDLAKVSGTPGKTRLLNFYRINGRFYWVDLPGYGYAQVSKQMRLQWHELIEGYLTGRENLRGVIHIMDIRHPPTADDVQMHAWLLDRGLPFVLVATKADKVARGKWPNHVKALREALNLTDSFPVIVFSAKNGQGAAEVLREMEKFLF